MLDILALPAQKSGSIKLSTPITTVTSTKSLSTGKPRILLTSTDNTFTVDRLIVTIPLGCLKRTSITFTPPLPPRLLQSISSLSYGTLEKIYVRFPTPFWHTSPTSSSFFNFLAPTYAPDTNPRKWHMCCFSLAHLPAPHNQPTLLFYVFGSASKHITSSAFSPSHTPHGQAQYAAFTQPYFSRLDGYTPECVPSRIVATAWSNDEYAGFGSYSNFQVGLHDGERDIEVLAEGLAEEGVWFAGEHTAPVLGLGSVSGAYWSGEIAAVKVVGSFEGGDEGVDGVDGVVDGVDGVDGMDGVGKPVDEAGKPVDGVCA